MNCSPTGTRKPFKTLVCAVFMYSVTAAFIIEGSILVLRHASSQTSLKVNVPFGNRQKPLARQEPARHRNCEFPLDYVACKSKNLRTIGTHHRLLFSIILHFCHNRNAYKVLYYEPLPGITVTYTDIGRHI